MATPNDVSVSLEFNPNPNTLKYSVNRQILEKGAMNFIRKVDADQKSPLAAKLFGVDGISGVMIGKDFVTVTKAESGDWDNVHKSASTIIEEHLYHNEPVFNPGSLDAQGEPTGQGNGAVENKIREILDNEIRPAVAMDGGDITFERFENGVVYLHLQGSCAGCPSSTMTLKQGIETRLKEALPEVHEVVSV